MRNSKRPLRHSSMGELISTLCFYGVAAYFFIDGFESYDSGEQYRAIGKWVASLLCFMGGARFQIASLWLSFRRK